MATKSIAWNSGGGYIRLTYTGSGNGHISVESDDNSLGTTRSQTIIVRTTDGGVITKNLTVKQAACPFPVNHVETFNYTGDVQSVMLPAGTYKLQCWGAQGGSGGGNAGGKGGYSEGVLTIDEIKTLYAFVGGQGSTSGNGGWNGGGGGSGYSSYNSGDEYGYSYFGCGGGATDFALKTSDMSYSSYRTGRSSESLLSRIIVAGGGSGGAYGYQKNQVTSSQTYYPSSISDSGWCIGADPSSATYYNHWFAASGGWYASAIIDVSAYRGGTCTLVKDTSLVASNYLYAFITSYPQSNLQSVNFASGYTEVVYASQDQTVTVPENASYLYVYKQDSPSGQKYWPASVTLSITTTSTNSDTQNGYVGGGTNGGGYSSSYYGKQNGAGSNGGFGYGANQTVSNYRYAAACGGGGWYGGGNSYSDNGLSTIEYSGGGSGWVNTSSSAGNRPSGYTGLQLDSGTTYGGTSSFPAPGGGNETGHSGNGYAKITRLS